MFTQLEHLLVPLDFSDRNDDALDAAHGIASETGARISLIHVVEPVSDADDPELQAFTQRLSDDAEASLRERARRFEDLDITVSCENRVGRRHAEVIRYAAENGVDLIVLNGHQVEAPSADRSPFSLSYQIAMLAPCDVLLIKS